MSIEITLFKVLEQMCNLTKNKWWMMEDRDTYLAVESEV